MAKGCGCKTKTIIRNGESVTVEDKPNTIKLIISGFLLSLLVTILLPVIWVILLVMVWKSLFGTGLDLSALMIKFMGKGKKVDKDDDISGLNPEDYELVNVDTIK